MYSPVRDGIETMVGFVRYTEAPPPSTFAALVHCFWELKTDADLPEDFLYHALPDACVNILFNQIDTDIAGITALRTKAELLNLGTSFHYVGIQFYPGVWNGNKADIVDCYVGTPYVGNLPLIQTSKTIAKTDFSAKVPALCDFVQWLLDENLIVPHAPIAKILAHLDDIRSVEDMARMADLSTRQLQRVVKRTTGLSPHDLLKVLRVQQSFSKHYLDLYADQSHYIHSFRTITGYTPRTYAAKFDV